MHLKLIGLMSITLLLTGCITGNSYTSSKLRYDGVYKSQSFVDGEKYCEYVRFYSDGAVITVGSICTKSALKDIKKWFDVDNAGPEFAGISEGTIHVSRNQIKFDVTSKEGKISYDGIFSSNHMRLSYHSHITQERGYEDYKFVKW
jgi:hypothetical protein